MPPALPQKSIRLAPTLPGLRKRVFLAFSGHLLGMSVHEFEVSLKGLLPLQFIECDRQVAYPLSGGMIDRISDRGWYADDTDFA